MNAGMTRMVTDSTGRLLVVSALAMSLAACGGGGGSAGTSGTAGTGATGSTSATGSTATANAKLALTLVDGTNTGITTLSGGQSGVIRAKFTDSKGVILPNAVVKFTASDATLVQFTPVSGSALTDATGTAVINVKPTDFNSAGALTVTAQATLDTRTASGTVNISVGAASLVVGALSFNPVPTSALAAFNTLTLNVPVSSNGQPVTTAPGLVLSSLCSGDGTATLAASGISNGVVAVSYTNKGCNRGKDTITASIGSSSQSIVVDVSSANIGTISFTSSNLQGTSLVLKGTGGLGRLEAALLTFKVVDQTGAALSGVPVTFTPTTSTGGLKVSPAQGTTDSSGNVTTSVLSGTIPTPVRVLAQATRNGATISGISDALTISTGLPIQKAMSLSVDAYNIEGGDYDGEKANVTLRMADQYGNPISDGTTINFVTEGGAIGTALQGACQTSNGGCTVPLISQNFRPKNGRVTILAYAQGIENFVDLNGDGQYSCSSFTSPAGNASATFRPLVDTCNPGAGEPFTDMGDVFLDAGSLAQTTRADSGSSTFDNTYNPENGDLPFPYNHPTYSASGDNSWGLNYIRSSAEIIFSGSQATLIRQVCDANGNCRDYTSADGDPRVINNLAGPGCSAQALSFKLIDRNNNPLPAETTVAATDADKISGGTVFPAIVPSTSAIGGTFHQVIIKPDSACAVGSINISVATKAHKIGTVFSFKSN
jgi:hypothetical protein